MNETFLPEFLRDAGYYTAMYGKWHLGFFKQDHLPMSRGFQEQSGIYNAMADHYTHVIGPGYDWHINQTTDFSVKGMYSGDIIRDNAVGFIHKRGTLGVNAGPFFLYVPFQEAHSPDQVDQKWKDMYPSLAAYPERQALCGMITHTDAMVGDIVTALNTTGLYDNTVIFFSSDNGGPGGQDAGVPRPSRFDSVILDRNWPFRGQKHELYEGGVRVPGFVHSPLLPDGVKGSTLPALIHITDWLPTIMAATGASLDSRKHQPIDGVNQWPCITGQHDKCTRNEVVLNINTVCDPAGSTGEFNTECPAPKAAMRVGDIKLLAECFDTTTLSFKGKLLLYNVSADPSELQDLAAAMPDVVESLSVKLLAYGKEAAMIPPLGDSAPWQVVVDSILLTTHLSFQHSLA